MITVLARFEMLEGKENAALAAIQKMAKAVEENEPGALVYHFYRGKVNPREVYVFEVYRDQEAFDLHRRTPHMVEMQAAFVENMDRGSFNVEMLEPIAGFLGRPDRGE